jgi:predicted transcriptional regulator
MQTIASNQSPESDRYLAQRYRISVALSEFTLPLLRRLYGAFDGDLILAMIYGEIGIHNAGAWLKRSENDARALQDLERHGEIMRPCNALSIAEATGIPRETVRRKVAALIKRGLVYRDAGNYLFVHPSATDGFDAMTMNTMNALRETAERVNRLLADDVTP